MRQKAERYQSAAERTIKDIRRQTRKRYTAEDKIRILLAGLRGEDRQDAQDGDRRANAASSGLCNLATLPQADQGDIRMGEAQARMSQVKMRERKIAEAVFTFAIAAYNLGCVLIKDSQII